MKSHNNKSKLGEQEASVGKPQCILPYSDKRNQQITQIWESDVFRWDLAYSTSTPSLEQKHSSCWKVSKSR